MRVFHHSGCILLYCCRSISVSWTRYRYIFKASKVKNFQPTVHSAVKVNKFAEPCFRYVFLCLLKFQMRSFLHLSSQFPAFRKQTKLKLWNRSKLICFKAKLWKLKIYQQSSWMVVVFLSPYNCCTIVKHVLTSSYWDKSLYFFVFVSMLKGLDQIRTWTYFVIFTLCYNLSEIIVSAKF